MFKIEDMSEFLKAYVTPGNLFNLYRVVDYTTHEVYDIRDGRAVKQGGLCYDIWRKGEPCRNCISKHTCMEDKRFFKLEFLDEVVFLIFSIPIELDGKKYSLELASDATESMVVASGWKGDNTEVMKLIEDFNNVAVHDSATGLYNKNYMLDQLINFTSRQDLDGTLSALFVSIDNYEDIVERYGNDMAEIVISRVGGVMREVTESPDIWAGRYGVKEFCLFLRNKPRSKAEEKRIEIAEKTEAIAFRRDDVPLNIEVCSGFAEMGRLDTLESFVDSLRKSLLAERVSKSIALKTGI